MALYGALSRLPLDVASRLGLANMIPATGALKISNDGDQRAKELAEIGGPVMAGLGKKAVDAYSAASLGKWDDAAKQGLPSAVSNALTGMEMAKTGKARDPKGREKADVSLADAAFKGMGFNPTVIADKNRQNMPMYQDLALQRVTEAAIVEQWAQALAQGDRKEADKAQARMEDWNKRNPNTPIVISSSQLRSRVKTMMMPPDARMLKTAPREMRGRVSDGMN